MDKQSFIDCVNNGSIFALYCLNVLYHRQTPDEKRPARTFHRNGRGFDKFNAPYGTFLAERSMSVGLTTNEINKVKDIVLKHKKQLCPVIHNETPWRKI